MDNNVAQDLAIEVKDLKIRYRSFKKISIRKTLLSLKKNETEIFEAVKGISFDVPKGQIMGIVGKNGSGKKGRNGGKMRLLFAEDDV